MFLLRVSAKEAKGLIASIRHDNCRNSISTRWHVGKVGVQGPSVLWLFCWGKTGMGSNEAAEDARRVFDKLFWVNFKEFDSRIDHKWARGERYRTGNVSIGRVEKRLDELFGDLQKEHIGTFGFHLPEEVSDIGALVEGSVHPVQVNAYERNPEARRLCIAHYGTSCYICCFNFGTFYGEVAEGFIHVHHLRPLSEVRAEYTVDPIEDLRPVCPNCHAVLHLRKPAFSIHDLKAFRSNRPG